MRCHGQCIDGACDKQPKKQQSTKAHKNTQVNFSECNAYSTSAHHLRTFSGEEVPDRACVWQHSCVFIHCLKRDNDDNIDDANNDDDGDDDDDYVDDDNDDDDENNDDDNGDDDHDDNHVKDYDYYVDDGDYKCDEHDGADMTMLKMMMIK